MSDPLEHLRPSEELRSRTTTATLVAGSLRDAIQSGRLADGAELNQVAIAERFGVSRVPVREALRVLEAEGWITALPNRRAVVSALSAEQIDEIFAIRALLEAYLIEKSIDRITKERIARLRELCDAMDACGDHQQWVTANADFHRTLLEAADSPVTLQIINQLSSQVERYLRLRGTAVIRQHEAGREHRTIVTAVALGDVKKATKVLRAHIDQTRQHVAEVIRSEASA